MPAISVPVPVAMPAPVAPTAAPAADMAAKTAVRPAKSADHSADNASDAPVKDFAKTLSDTEDAAEPDAEIKEDASQVAIPFVVAPVQPLPVQAPAIPTDIYATLQAAPLPAAPVSPVLPESAMPIADMAAAQPSFAPSQPVAASPFEALMASATPQMPQMAESAMPAAINPAVNPAASSTPVDVALQNILNQLKTFPAQPVANPYTQSAQVLPAQTPLAAATQQLTQAVQLVASGNQVQAKPLVENAIASVQQVVDALPENAENAEIKASMEQGLQMLKASSAAPVVPQGEQKPLVLDEKGDKAPVVAAAVAAMPVQVAEAPAPVKGENAPKTDAPVITASAISASSSRDNNTQANTDDGAGNAQNAPIAAPPQPVALTAHNTAPEKSFAQMVDAAPKPVHEQIAFQMRSVTHNGNNTITIQLDPIELGKIDIRMDIGSDGKTGLTITADNRNTLDMLQKDIRALSQALNDAGMKTDSSTMNFNLRDGQGSNQQQAQQQQQQSYRQQSAYAASQVDPVEEALLQAPVRTYTIPVREGLDIHI